MENGLKESQFTITDEALELLATRYTREAGVRQMERTIGAWPASRPEDCAR